MKAVLDAARDPRWNQGRMSGATHYRRTRPKYGPTTTGTVTSRAECRKTGAGARNPELRALR